MRGKSPRPYIHGRKKAAILKAYSGICYYCKEPYGAFVDHIVPAAKGGTNGLENLTVACLSCNMRKFKHRLPPEHEQRALADAKAMIPKIKGLLTGGEPVVPINGWQCRAARGGLDLTLGELAILADVSINTLVRLERISDRDVVVKNDVMRKIRAALEEEGADFLFDMKSPGDRGVRIRLDCLPARFYDLRAKLAHLA